MVGVKNHNIKPHAKRRSKNEEFAKASQREVCRGSGIRLRQAESGRANQFQRDASL